ncbi:PapD-like protein [Blastocladiella britannica]|nr:PapD-like protein [Blastocladiella britannica]
MAAAFADLLELDPSDQLTFTEDPGTALLTLRNRHPTHRIAYKLKTNSPTNYAVRPNLGTLAVGESMAVAISSRVRDDLHRASSGRNKFLVQVMVLEKGELDKGELEVKLEEVAILFRAAPPSRIAERKLRTVFTFAFPSPPRYDDTLPAYPRHDDDRRDSLVVPEDDDPAIVTPALAHVAITTTTPPLPSPPSSSEQPPPAINTTNLVAGSSSSVMTAPLTAVDGDHPSSIKSGQTDSRRKRGLGSRLSLLFRKAFSR